MAKTGGTTVYNVLRSVLGEGAITDQLALPHRETLIRYGWKTLISAHTSFSVDDEFDPERYYFTVLREPMDRALSNYWFARGLTDAPIGPVRLHAELAQTYSLETLLYSENRAHTTWLSNVQAMHYAGLICDITDLESDEQLLCAAKEALDRFDLVGVNEDLEDLLLVVGAECGIPISGNAPRMNATSQRKSVSELPIELQEQLERLNTVDTELYRYAGQLFHEQRKRALRGAALCQSAGAGGAETLAVVTGSGRTPITPREAGGEKVRIAAISILGELSETGTLLSSEVASIAIQLATKRDLGDAILRLSIFNDGGQLIFKTSSLMLGRTLALKGSRTCTAEFVFRNDLSPGRYFISAALADAGGNVLHVLEFASSFEVGSSAGYYFEGMVNLNPSLRITCDGKVVEDSKGVSLSRLHRLGVATPPLSEFRASMRTLEELKVVKPGELIAIEVELENQSSEWWHEIGARPVQIGYRWLGSGGSEQAVEGVRTRLPRNIGPGESVRVFVRVRAPSQASMYKLHMSLVQEFVGWFDDHQTGYVDMDVEVRNSDR